MPSCNKSYPGNFPLFGLFLNECVGDVMCKYEAGILMHDIYCGTIFHLANYNYIYHIINYVVYTYDGTYIWDISYLKFGVERFYPWYY